MKKLILYDKIDDLSQLSFSNTKIFSPLNINFNSTKVLDIDFGHCNIIKSFSEYKKVEDEIHFKSLLYSQLIAKYFNPEKYDNYSEEFWDIIYYPCIYVLVSQIKKTELILDNLNKEELSVEIRSFEFNFYDLIDLVNSSSHLYYALISRELILLKKFINFKVIYRTNKKINIKSNANKRLRYFKYFYPSPGFKKHEVLFFNMLLGLKKTGNIQNRKNQVQSETTFISSDKIYLEIIKKLIPWKYKYLPNLKAHRIKSNKIFFPGGNIYEQIDVKIQTALNYEKNNQIICYQHGGFGYNFSYKTKFIENVEFKKDFKFLSWGWMQNSNFHIIPFYSKEISLLKKPKKEKTPKKIIAYLGGQNKCLHPGFVSNFTRPNDCLIFLKEKIKVIEKLYSIKNFVYCPPLKTPLHAINDEKLISKKFPNIIKTTFNKVYKNLGFVIMDQPGTTFNKCMSLNIPVKVIINDNINYFDSEYAPLIETFFELEIFIKLNDINDKSFEIHEIKKWWDSEEIQETRKNWCNKYTNTTFFFNLHLIKIFHAI